jgi:outer membrane protein assembly factor BamB
MSFIMNLIFCIIALAPLQLNADWPQWRGPTRDGNWYEPRFPLHLPKDAKPLWKLPLGGGYGGIAVANDKLFVMDRIKDGKENEPEEFERIHCLEPLTGKQLWLHSYKAAYKKLDYGNGPRTTPTIHQGKVYAFGSIGDIHCLDMNTGKVLWHRNAVADFNAKYPTWGYSSSPLIDENRVLLQIGGKPDACFIALDKDTGKEVWRSGSDRPGYASAQIFTVNNQKQIVWWSAQNACGLDPKTGSILWKSPVGMDYDVAIADLIFHEGVFLASDYWTGSKAIELAPAGPKVVWEGKQLSMLMCSPLVRDGYFYALDRFRGIKCIEAKTGKIMWENESVTVRGTNPQASLVWVGKRALIFNEKGELILAELSPKEFKLVDKISVCGFTWAHPAFAQGCIFARTDKEIVAVQLFKP